MVIGEFFKGVHQTPHDPGRSCHFCLDYPLSFFKVFL